MNISNDKLTIARLLDEISSELGISSWSVISTISPEFNKALKFLDRAYDHENISSMPAYLKRSAELRKNPSALFPWAKSIIMTAIPFRNLPDSENKLPEAPRPEFSGLVAGYGLKKDYHSEGEKILQAVVCRLKDSLAFDFRTETCTDTKPMAERPLAFFSRLGMRGLNNCIMTENEKSGCFISSLVTDIPLPDIRGKKFEASCRNCGKCIENCPCSALNSVSGKIFFNPELCVSFMSKEKHGCLNRNERRAIGHWIFGCDRCTSICPGTELPKTKGIDLEWLLFGKSSEIKNAISDTPLAHSGVTLLRRNALCVLKNRNSEDGLKLIQCFAGTTGSEALKQSAFDILNDKP